MKIDKSKFLDGGGKPLTQSLFLEINYDENYAVYTLKDQDHEYNGKTYPSIKRLYLEMEDPTEYEFATKYLLGWQHWKRLCANAALRKHIDEWREELELKIVSQGVRDMINLTGSEGGSFQAARWLAERGWEKRKAGRPSKAEIDKRVAQDAKIREDFEGDIARMEEYRKRKG